MTQMDITTTDIARTVDKNISVPVMETGCRGRSGRC